MQDVIESAVNRATSVMATRWTLTACNKTRSGVFRIYEEKLNCKTAKEINTPRLHAVAAICWARISLTAR